MAVASPDIQFETVLIPHKAYEFVRNGYRFNIYHVAIGLAVYLRKAILFVYGVIDFRYRVAVVRLLVYAFVERAIDRTYRVIAGRLGQYGKSCTIYL